MKTTSWILTASLLAPSSGCGTLFTIVRPGEEQVSGKRLSGDVCSPIETRREIDGVSTSRSDGRMIEMSGKVLGSGAAIDADPKLQILGVACVDDLGTNIAERLHHLDPLEADPFEVAVTIAECGRALRCLGKVNPDEPGDHDAYVAGLLSWYSANLDRDAVEARVKASGAPAMASSLFMEQLDTTRRDIEAIVRGLDGAEKAIFLDTPHELAEARVHEHEAFAEPLEAVRALAETAADERSKGVSDGTIAALEDLRRDHVTHCGDFACMRDPVGNAVARELFFAHISRVDVPAAIAELPYLPKGRHMDRVAAAQAELMREHESAYEVTQRGIENGLDADTANAAAGGVEPLSFDGVYVFDFSRYAEPWDHMIPPSRTGKVVQYTHRVKKKVVEGERTTLHFFDDVRTWKQEVCHDTNRVDRIDGGRVYYKRRCKQTGKTESMRTEHEPITLPTREAEAVKAKEWVSYVGLTGEHWTGRIRSVKQEQDSEEAVQLRDVRLK